MKKIKLAPGIVLTSMPFIVLGIFGVISGQGAIIAIVYGSILLLICVLVGVSLIMKNIG